MKEEFAQKILKKNKRDYKTIAENFSGTRAYLWPELLRFEEYVKEGDKVLDLGCGNGRFYELFKNKKVEYIGVDNCQKLISLARKKYPNANFIFGDALNLPFKNSEFDLVFSIAVFHHIPSQKYRRQVLKEIYRVLKPDGLLVLTVWNLWQPKLLIKYKIWPIIFGWRKKYMDWKDVFIPWKLPSKKVIYRYYHAFCKNELRNLIKQSGFEINNCYYTQKNRKTNWLKGFNLVVLAKKV
ncbi:class I SAM-dependent methyltransferase [bacterium]|nr:class I SAM-dependent methyltransferase [bacterium]